MSRPAAIPNATFRNAVPRQPIDTHRSAPVPKSTTYAGLLRLFTSQPSASSTTKWTNTGSKRPIQIFETTGLAMPTNANAGTARKNIKRYDSRYTDGIRDGSLS